ncbi:MAG: DUF2442 domain-containing protein [Bacteroidota bacterium]
MLYLIKEIINKEPYKLTLRFNTGEIKILDLEEKIKSRSKTKNSKYKALLDPDYFNSVKLQPEWETIYWNNGLDFCPDVLYDMGKSV